MNLESLKLALKNSHNTVEIIVWLSIFLIAGLFVGALLEMFLKRFGNRFASMTKWKFDDFLVRSLRGTLIPLCTVISLYIAANLIPELRNAQWILNKSCFAAIAFFITLIVARFSSRVVRHLCDSSAAPLPSTFLSSLASVFVFIIGTLVALQTFGISITPILTTLGIGGLAVALALQDTLANLFSGVYILISKQVRLGDYVRLDSGNEGYISDITWRNTVIKTLSNNFIIIPNSKLASAIITNFCLPAKETTFQLDLGIGYESDLSKVERITKDTIKEVLQNIPGAVTSFEPLIRYHTFGPSSINFSIIIKANEYSNQVLIKHECIKMLHSRYKEENITIPYPIQTIHLEKCSS